MNTWHLAWRLARYRPGLFGASFALLVATEGARIAVFYGAAVVWNASWNVMQTLVRVNLLRWLLTGKGAGRLPDSPGEAVSRFRDDVEELAVFIDTWLDAGGTAVFTAIALAIMVTINAWITLVVLLPLALIGVINRLMTSRI